jgi:hypothetical protein
MVCTHYMANRGYSSSAKLAVTALTVALTANRVTAIITVRGSALLCMRWCWSSCCLSMYVVHAFPHGSLALCTFTHCPLVHLCVSVRVQNTAQVTAGSCYCSMHRHLTSCTLQCAYAWSWPTMYTVLIVCSASDAYCAL